MNSSAEIKGMSVKGDEREKSQERKTISSPISSPPLADATDAPQVRGTDRLHDPFHPLHPPLSRTVNLVIFRANPPFLLPQGAQPINNAL